VKLNQLGLKRFHELDNHSVVDVCGVGLKYLPYGKTSFKQGDYEDIELKNPQRYDYGCNVLRGIEVKISRSDYRNGFICTGCNYHYLLTPMRLVAQHEIPKGVGLIEFNKYKFSCELETEHMNDPRRRAFRFKGLRVVKRPTYRRIPQFQIDNAISGMFSRFKKDMERVFLEIQTSMEKPGIVYRHPNRHISSNEISKRDE
jgi:hypothetical protein